jgi:hypothetical protein
MKTPHYSVDRLCAYLQQHLIATFEQLRRALGSPGRATVFRMLAKTDALSSYSHRGRFYTLRSIAGFSAKGLWECKQVRFSRFGNLLETLQELVERSPRGYSAKELEEMVGVKTKHALVELVQRTDLERHRLGGRYIYVSAQRTRAREQQRRRREKELDLPSALLGSQSRLALQEAKAALLLFWATLDEKQRRLYAGLESAKMGHGGDEHIAELFGIDRHTVARGRDELLEGFDPSAPVRRPGGGRAAREKKRPKSSRTSSKS